MSTAADREILNHIFNPLLPLGTPLVEEEIVEDDNEVANDESEDAALSRSLELEGVRAAEACRFDTALELFSSAIKIMPFRASPYNNRAQTYRLKGLIEEAKLDLESALALSERKGRTGRQAFCQRALIALKENRSDEAKVDFEAAAKLGSQFAKAQLVQMNPYAALCNRMLKDVMGKLARGESEYYAESNQTGCKY